MSPLAHLAALAAIAAAAGLLVRTPRRLFTEAAGMAPAKRLEWGLGAALALAGAAAYAVAGGYGLSGRLTFVVAIMAFLAVVYSDLSFLIIPDVYSAILGLVALTAPWRLPLAEAAIGAAICGGLLAVLAFVWRRVTAVEGLGFGDVKLAAATGGLLGAQAGLLAVSVSAGLAAILIYGLRLAKPSKDAAPLIPYGAALALAGGAFLGVRVL